MSSRVESGFLRLATVSVITALLAVASRDHSHVFAVSLSLMGWLLSVARTRVLPGYGMLGALALVLVLAVLDQHYVVVAAAAGLPLGLGAREVRTGADPATGSSDP